MSEASGKEFTVLNRQEFADGLFDLGYDRSFGRRVFSTIVCDVAADLEPTYTETVLTRPFISSLPESNPAHDLLRRSHERAYTRDVTRRIRTADSIALSEVNRDGVQEAVVCLPNLAVVADDLYEVMGMGPRAVEATLALLASHQLLEQASEAAQ